MSQITISKLKRFDRNLNCSADKSITHRAIMFNGAASGKAVIRGGLLGEDCLNTIECMRALGAKISIESDTVTVKADGIDNADLYVGNSGTTMRLMTGLLSGRCGRFTLSGDASIQKRPMRRVIEPLTKMGAQILSNEGFAPLTVTGKNLMGIAYDSPIPSAQVKSAILLAGLNADGVTSVSEKFKSRDHTELMLKAMNASIKVDGNTVSVQKSGLKCVDVLVAGDISSAAFPLVLAAIVKDSRVVVRNVGINPTRTGILDVLKDVGADYRLFNVRNDIEATADIELNYAPLKPFKIEAKIIPRLIDEIPALAVLACFIEGTSVITGAEELKVKESDRITTTVNFLKSMGADIEATDDGMIIRGGRPLCHAVVDPRFDHRIAMAAAVAGAAAEGVTIVDAQCASVSYPNFYNLFD